MTTTTSIARYLVQLKLCIALIILSSQLTDAFIPIQSRARQLFSTRQFIPHHGTIRRMTTKQASTKKNDDATSSIVDSFLESSDHAEQVRDDFRCGFVSIIGAPNMGKSTLLNALIEDSLCIATARPQTTRHAILGLLSNERCQVCLFDTPGVIGEPAYKLQEGMMEAVVSAFRDADVLLVVTDLFSTPIDDDTLFEKMKLSGKPTIVSINKIDLASKVNVAADDGTDKTVTVEEAVDRWRSLLPNALVVLPMVAANGALDPGVVALRRILTGGPNVPEALRELGRPLSGMYRDGFQFVTDDEAMQLLPLSPPLYDTDILTDRTERFIASETIRAALFELLKKEIPYCCEVQINSFKEPTEEDTKPVLRINASVIVERNSQKGIVVGKGGEKIKLVGTNAREKLEDFFKKKVYLNLSVKVDKDWRKSEDRLKQYGYIS
ncbi:hypothetical protein MPSEU_000168600 [Mayamaea pseudoterrestris]|nr:hypothetical protein MPSEU_000168600 [Mayamaea pseudoterrestris]